MAREGDEPTNPERPYTPPLEESSEHPERIGPYRILQLLGEGGMGVVYEAEQTVPLMRRVALKVIKLGMDTKQVVARFEAERQALAVMDHPGIAKVYDAGATEDGRPFFAMERVRGVPLTEYCDNNRLTTNERLKIFIELCHAIQHAHQKGVIHRDLKPSNILVTVQDGKPSPKVIDFGIAKAVGRRLSNQTLVTEFGHAIGTPAYMSPEQAEMSGLDVDTRTDVYSLGVMLYELLVGSLPIDPETVGLPGFIAQLVLRETDPLTPSSRLSSLGKQLEHVARQRRTDPAALKRQLRGDLDWITMKTLDQDRTRRYETTNALALDLERYMADEPVLARPPSVTYRARKFARRNRTAVALGAGLALTLIALAAAMAVLAGRIASERDRAEQEAQTAQQVSDFLVGLFSVSDPGEARGNSITAREILDKGAEEIERELQDQPQVQGRLMDVMGNVYQSLGLFRDAEPLVRSGLEVRRQALGDEHPDVAASLHSLAWLLRSVRRLDEALPLAQQAVAIRERVLGPGSKESNASLLLLGMIQRDQGDFEAAEENLQRVLELREATLGPDHIDVFSSLYHLGWLQYQKGDFARARGLYERGCGIAERELDPDSPRLGWCFSDLAIVLDRLGDSDAARAYFERALGIFERVLSPDHPNLAALLNNLGGLHWRRGEYEVARPYYERSLRIKEAAFGPNHPVTADALMNLGLLLQSTGDYQGAYDRYLEALAIHEGNSGPSSPQAGEVLGNLGYLLRHVGEFADARHALERALRIREESLGKTHPDLLPLLVNLGFLARDEHRLEESVSHLQRVVAIVEENWGPTHVYLVTHLSRVARALTNAGRYDEALAAIGRARDIEAAATSELEADAPRRLVWEEARAHRGKGNVAVSDSLFEVALATSARENGAESAAYAETLARAWAQKGDQARTLQWFAETIRRGNTSQELLRDTELDIIRDHPDYRRFADQIRVKLRR